MATQDDPFQGHDEIDPKFQGSFELAQDYLRKLRTRGSSAGATNEPLNRNEMATILTLHAEVLNIREEPIKEKARNDKDAEIAEWMALSSARTSFTTEYNRRKSRGSFSSSLGSVDYFG